MQKYLENFWTHEPEIVYGLKVFEIIVVGWSTNSK